MTCFVATAVQPVLRQPPGNINAAEDSSNLVSYVGKRRKNYSKRKPSPSVGQPNTQSQNLSENPGPKAKAGRAKQGFRRSFFSSKTCCAQAPCIHSWYDTQTQSCSPMPENYKYPSSHSAARRHCPAMVLSFPSN